MMMPTPSPTGISWDEMRERVAAISGVGATIFVKMDIEGAEYEVLPRVLLEASAIAGFALEVHDLQRRWPEFVAVINMLKKDFCIVHVHGNNYAPLIDGTSVPSVLEITALNRALMSASELASHSNRLLPDPHLDMPNWSEWPDYPLTFSAAHI
jgi:hypothetical protein